MNSISLGSVSQPGQKGKYLSEKDRNNSKKEYLAGGVQG